MITIRFHKHNDIYYKNFETEKEINEFLDKELDILSVWILKNKEWEWIKF